MSGEKNESKKVIQVDTRQKHNQKNHKYKEQFFESQGFKILKSKLAVGDYCIPSNCAVVVDTKKDCSELYSNLIQDHRRFHDECVLAQECGIKLIILVENKDGFEKPDDIINWKNPQMFRYWKAKKQGSTQKPPASNVQLLKIMHAMSRDYGVDFRFCKPEDAGHVIIEILTGEENGKRLHT